MKAPAIKIDDNLSLVSVEINNDKLVQLVKVLAKGRKSRCRAVKITSGIPLVRKFGHGLFYKNIIISKRKLTVNELEKIDKKGQAVLFGRTSWSSIDLYPEAILISGIVSGAGFSSDRLFNLREFKETVREELARGLLEELEHTYQNAFQLRYLLGRKAGRILIFSNTVLVVMFLNFLFSLNFQIMTAILTGIMAGLAIDYYAIPKKFADTNKAYESDRLEIDAKKIANNEKNIQLALKAIKLGILNNKPDIQSLVYFFHEKRKRHISCTNCGTDYKLYQSSY